MSSQLLLYIKPRQLQKFHNILSHNETKSYYQLILDNDYINKLINKQSNLEEVDTVSGATISSTALKKMVINTLEDYEENYGK